MRVLFLATRDIRNPAAAGGDIQMWEYARYLANRGHQVAYVASRFPKAPETDVVDGISVVRLGGILSLWWRTYLYYVRHCARPFDVVIVEGFGGSRIPRFAPLYVREPLITEWHQLHADLFANQYPKAFVPLLGLLERVTAYVHRNTIVRAGTEEWKEAFPQLGFKRENIVVVPVSVRDEWFEVSEVRSNHGPNLVWLGKFRRYKCPHHAILAMAFVLQKVPAATLYLLGRHDDERYERYLQRLADKGDLRGRVHFAFDVNEEEKKTYLNAARLLVMPSSVEGFGIAGLEANALGVPVVASSGVPKGAVADGYNGLRYEFGNIESLAEAIVSLMQDDNLHRRLSANAREFARQFTWSRVGARFEQVAVSAAKAGMGIDWLQGQTP